MKKTVYCVENEKNVHSFYLTVGHEEYYLFSQAYRVSVNEYFGGNGVPLSDALDFSHSRGDTALMRTVNKLFSYIRYIENEYQISVLDKTVIKTAKTSKKVPDRRRQARARLLDETRFPYAD